MSLILSLETSTEVCSVALHKDGQLMASQKVMVDKSHSEYLALMIRDLLIYTRTEMQDLSAVAIARGPGSYTGLRIGTSTAKGICYGLQIPLISINSLVAMAFQVNSYNHNKYLLCPMIDARRMEVYCMILNDKMETVRPTEALIVEENTFEDDLEKQQILFFGNGMPKTKKILSTNKNAYFVDGIHPEASSIGFLASEKYRKKEFENLASFEPFYLKDFMAGIPKKLI